MIPIELATEIVNITVPAGFMLVPEASVVFYPEWYFTAWTSGVGIIFMLLGVLLGKKMERKKRGV